MIIKSVFFPPILFIFINNTTPHNATSTAQTCCQRHVQSGILHRHVQSGILQPSCFTIPCCWAWTCCWKQWLDNTAQCYIVVHRHGVSCNQTVAQCRVDRHGCDAGGRGRTTSGINKLLSTMRLPY